MAWRGTGIARHCPLHGVAAGARCVLVFFSGRHGDQRPTLSLTVLLDVLMRLMLGLLECIRLQDDREIARGGLDGRDEFHGAFLHFLANGIVTFSFTIEHDSLVQGPYMIGPRRL